MGKLELFTRKFNKPLAR